MTTQYWMMQPQAKNELRHILASKELPEGHVAAVAAPKLDVDDGVATIPISGFLMQERSELLDYFGYDHTGYGDIVGMVAAAESNPKVSSIRFAVDSPGGEASNALIAAGDAIHAASKPTSAIVGDMAASAAYWLASQADTITLTGEASMVGSIGVAVDMWTSDRVVSIASTDAPKKRPDVTTDEGVADVRRELDDLHALFVAAVSRGRGVSAAKINEDFGQGGVVLAEKAVSIGMADALNRPGMNLDNRDKLASMDSATPTPGLDKAAYDAAVQAGVQQERARVAAHLMLAEGSGAMSASIGHIKSGAAVDDPMVFAEHASARLNASKQEALVDDNADEASSNSPDASGEESAINATFAMIGA